MAYGLLIQHEAVIEAQYIFESYEQIKTGLGFEFIELLEKCYACLETGAKFYSFIDTKKIYRRISLDRFPCMIVYEIEKFTVVVISIGFEREDPEKRKRFTK